MLDLQEKVRRVPRGMANMLMMNLIIEFAGSGLLNIVVYYAFRVSEYTIAMLPYTFTIPFPLSSKVPPRTCSGNAFTLNSGIANLSTHRARGQ
jgi:hypothetical protein